MYINNLLSELNNNMQEMIKNDNVNHIKMFVASDLKSKISVTLKAHTKYNDFYHGLHPKFDEHMLRNFLTSLKDNTSTEFWLEVENAQSECDKKLMNMILPESISIKDEYINSLVEESLIKNLEISLLGKAILQMASHFGYTLKVADKYIYEVLKNDLRNICVEKVDYWSFDDNLKEIYLLGIWPIHYLEALCYKYNICHTEDGFYVKTVNKKENIKDNILYKMLSFENEWIIFFRLLTSDVYYSGVMPCVQSIDYEVDSSSSEKIKYLVFNVIRTTFGTVDALDHSQILNHSFFIENQEHRERLNRFNFYEDKLQNDFLYSQNLEKQESKKEYEGSIIERLNMYLSHSLNTHTIAVSANLITEDGYLIAGKRGNLSIDAGEYYCSANGQTEFIDEHVEFYRKSVFEDMPTMNYFSKYRIDLNNEIQRESIAELGVTSFDFNWDCYGVSYLSINNDIQGINTEENTRKSESINFRRMHFNVLMSNYIKQPFKDVIKNHSYATESFENVGIKGIKVRIFKNRIDFLKSIGLIAYNWIDENKSRILLMLLFLSILLGKKNGSELGLEYYFDITLVIIYLLMSLVRWFKDRKLRRHMLSIYYYLPRYFSNNELKTKEILNILLRKIKDGNLHAIFKMMYMLYFLNLVESDKD